MIYYRYCFHIEDMSPSEGLVYSAIVSDAIKSHPEFFSSDGKFCTDVVKSYIQDYWGKLFLPTINVSQLSRRLEMTRATILQAFKKLKKKTLISRLYVEVDDKLLDEGYFNIPEGTGLSGMQLLFYGHLLNYSEKYKGIIAIQTSTLAKQVCISWQNVRCILSILYKKGFVERLPDGKLRIKKKGEALAAPPIEQLNKKCNDLCISDAKIVKLS